MFMAMNKKYRYIAICATKFDEEKFRELTSGISVDILGDFRSEGEITEKDCFVYSLITNVVSYSYTEYLNTRFAAYSVDSLEDFASYILAHRLGATLEELFNE